MPWHFRSLNKAPWQTSWRSIDAIKIVVIWRHMFCGIHGFQSLLGWWQGLSLKTIIPVQGVVYSLWLKHKHIICCPVLLPWRVMFPVWCSKWFFPSHMTSMTLLICSALSDFILADYFWWGWTKCNFMLCNCTVANCHWHGCHLHSATLHFNTTLNFTLLHELGRCLIYVRINISVGKLTSKHHTTQCE